MFLALGGDERELREAHARASKRFAEWLQRKRDAGHLECSDELAGEMAAHAGLLTYRECANVGVHGLQTSINRAVVAIDPAAHTRETTEAERCPTCRQLRPVDHGPAKRPTRGFGE